MRPRGQLRYSDFESDEEDPEQEEEDDDDEDEEEEELMTSSGRGRRRSGGGGRRRQRGGGRGSKSSWLPHEDDLLLRLVREHGQSNWSLIAKHFTGRIGKQCRERWHNQLRPDIKRDAWDAAEERLLIDAHRRIGNKWADIAKMIPGRTENAVKNHWNATLRRKDCGPRGGPDGRGNTLLKEYMKMIGVGNGLAAAAAAGAAHSHGVRAGVRYSEPRRPPTKRRVSVAEDSGDEDEGAEEQEAAALEQARHDQRRRRTAQEPAPHGSHLFGSFGQGQQQQLGGFPPGAFGSFASGATPDSQQQLVYLPALGQQTVLPIPGSHNTPLTGSASAATRSGSGSRRAAGAATHLIFSPLSSSGQALPGMQDKSAVKALSQEFDVMLHRRRRPRGSSLTADLAAAAAAAACGVNVKREPPSTPELDTIMDWLTSVNGTGVPSPTTTTAKLLMPASGAESAQPITGAAAGGRRSSILGLEASLRDAFRTPDIPMLGVSLFSPQTQSQLDFSTLAGDLLLEGGHDPLGLMSPLGRPPQASHFRPSSGVSSVKPEQLLAASGSTAAAAAAASVAATAPFRLTSAAQSSQANSVHRRSDNTEVSFLRSPRNSIPALFKSPEEQKAAGLPVQQQRQHPPRPPSQQQQQQRRRSSLLSPGTGFSGQFLSPLAPPAAAAEADSSADASTGGQQTGGSQAATSGRNLIVVQTAPLASNETYLKQLHCAGLEVATYSGCIPGLSVLKALPQLPEAAAGLRQRLLEVVAELCSSIRSQGGRVGLGDILVALRLGPLEQGDTGLVVAIAGAVGAAAAAVQQAVAHLRSIELQ